MSNSKSRPPATWQQKLKGLGIGGLITSSTFLFGPPVLATGLLKVVIPSRKLDSVAIGLTNQWLAFNNWLIDHALPEIEWQVTLPPNLSLEGRYLLLCNHQSWVDTTVMQYIGLTRMPLARFFTKWELIFIPFLGLAFKILGFPMMKRHSAAAIAKNPALKKQDLEEAKRACSQLQSQPYTLLNYLEGTRFTPTKHANQKSPFKHLLKPKSGGVALALNILGGEIDRLIDMTIVYPDGIPSYPDFWTGQVKRIGVDLREISIPDWVLNGNYEEDAEFKEQFQIWIGQIWQDKDALIEQMLKNFAGKNSPLAPSIPSLTHKDNA
jgi:1-acyl-sn-glycerol-3-phosphate acyltransferase